MTETAPLEAVLFDMDGTVIDTEPLWFKYETEYVTQHGQHWSEEDAMGLVGASARVTTKALRERAGTDASHEEILDFLTGHIRDEILTGGAPWRRGILDLLATLKGHSIPLALVTSSPPNMADALVSRLPEGTFDAVVTSKSVTAHKPSPEPYLKAAQMLGVDPARCVVLEDSISGIESALGAGTHPIAIPCMVDLPPRPGQSRVASAEDLTWEALQQIAAGTPIDLLAN